MIVPVRGGLKQVQAAEIHQDHPFSWAADIHTQREPSTLVYAIDYVEPYLIVTYKDGFKAKYEATVEEVKDFIRSSSKGRWAREHLWKRKYVRV